MDKRTFIGLSAVVLALCLAWLFWPDDAPAPALAIERAPRADAETPPREPDSPGPVAPGVAPPSSARLRPPEPPPVRAGSLEGQVRGEDGKPARATVHLKVLDVDVQGDIAQGAHYLVHNRSVETGGDGAFKFVVSPGSYELFARASKGATAEWTRVDVPAGARREVILTLETGFVVAGRTVGEAGEPVAGAQIVIREATRLDPQFSRHPEWRTPNAVSGPDGRFEARGLLLPPEGLRVHATHPERTDAVTELLAAPAGEIVLVMPPRVAGSGGRIRGKVTDENGQPVKGARVRVRSITWDEPRPRPRPGETWDQMIARTGQPALGYGAITGEDGTFDIDKLPAGKKRVTFEADGKRPTSMVGLQIKDGDVWAGIDAVLESGLSVDGRVVDDTGAPLAGADVVCIGSDQRAQLVLTAPDGSFRVAGLPEGPAILESSLPGYAVIRTTVAAGQSGVVLALPRVGALTGTVRKSGAPAERFRITVERIAGAAPADLSASVQEREFDKEARGAFRYDRVDPGTYRITAFVGQAQSAPAMVVVSPGQTAAVALEVP